jgi:transcriptional regulator with XRE-family HTH domain
MHVRTFYRQRRGDRTLAEASRATDINEGTLSRIERGEQLPKAEQCHAIAEFYSPEAFEPFLMFEPPPRVAVRYLYPASVLRCLQLERNCVDCGKALPPDSRANRKRHIQGGCS